jgi:hypothetical protein
VTTQPITGVSPASTGESTIMTTWPSMGATAFGQTLGRAYGIRAGLGNILTVGNLIALAAIPQALLLYLLNILPWSCRRYRLTNRRLVVEKGLNAKVDKEVPLDKFDAVEVIVHPGQEWYRCGDLTFLNGKVETFRLVGVPHPESFRQTCLKAARGYAGVKKATGR